MSKTITITRGLATLKTLEARIYQAISSGTYIGVSRGAAEAVVNSIKTKTQVESDINASFQSVNDLINERDAIKRAIVLSNAATKVIIGNVEMTVAEAIERKTSVKFEQNLLQYLMAAYSTAQSQMATQATRVDADTEKRLQTLFGADKTKVTAEQQTMVRNQVLSESEGKLIDPLKLDEKIQALRKKIEDFNTEVDFVLSESNARTEITI